MASITKRCRHRGAERDTCRCTWYVRQRQGGRETYTPVGPDRAAAERALRRLTASDAETVAEAADLWLAAKAADPKARPNSLASYRGRVAHVKAYFGDHGVRLVRAEDVARFPHDLLDAGYAPATVQGIYACLTAILKHARRRGVIRDLPLPPDGPGIPTPAPREHDLTLAQVEQIVADMPGVWGRVAELVLLTGLRWGEAVAVRPEDIDGNVLRVRRTRNRAGGVNPPKTAKGARLVPLSARARGILDDLELPVGGDYRRAYQALRAAFGDHWSRGMGWHVIRNANATLLERAGVTLRDQGARLGHGANYTQTLSYGLVSEAGSADAIDRARQHAASGPSAAPDGEARSAARPRAQRRPGD